jgi:hypothetical protein
MMAVIRVYDAAGNVIETHERAGEFKERLAWRYIHVRVVWEKNRKVFRRMVVKESDVFTGQQGICLSKSEGKHGVPGSGF